MPTANRRHLAGMALRCFAEQTYEPRELVVIDDGDDRIQDLVFSAARSYTHLHYVNATRMSTGAKRNLGCTVARGTVLCNWDDDDWSAPDRLAVQLAELMASGKKLTGFRSTVYWNERDGQFYKNPGPADLVSGTSQMYWRNWWHEHRFPDLSMGEDSQFAVAARAAGEIDVNDCGQLMVARAHALSTQVLDFSRLPRIARDKAPAGFLQALAKT